MTDIFCSKNQGKVIFLEATTGGGPQKADLKKCVLQNRQLTWSPFW